MSIGSRIKKRREEIGMTQDELAKCSGYKSRSSINKIEMDLNNLTQSKIKLIADALQTTPSYIMGWDEPLVLQEAWPKHHIKERISDKGTRIVCRMDTELYDTICSMAEKHDTSFEDEMEKILWDAVEGILEDYYDKHQNY